MTVCGLQWTQAADTYARPTAAATSGGATQNVLTHLAVTSPTNAETVAAVAQCNSIDPWMSMVRCNLWDTGVVTAINDPLHSRVDECYTDTLVQNMGQVMVRIKKFWYATDHTAGVYRWFISDTGTETVRNSVNGANLTWKVHPAFIRDGVTKDYVYISAYEGYYNATTSKMESKSGVQPTTSKYLHEFRTVAQLRAGVANKWEIQDYLTTSAIQLLYLIEYGDFDSQTVLSAGICNASYDGDHNQASNTGHTTALGNASGQVLHTFDHVPNSGDTTGYAMSYRGIENIYGNIYKYLDGINIKTAHDPWIADHDFSTNYCAFGPPYVNSTATPINATDGFISDIKVDATYDYGFLPSAVAGASGAFLSDYYQQIATDGLVSYGGSWADGSGATGMFRLGLAVAQWSQTPTLGSRLMYIG